MVAVFGEKVLLGQANGPDVPLIVRGTPLYATYETPDGLPAIYDESLGLFCYARVVDGEYQSTAVPVTSPAPGGVQPHAAESDAVRARKIELRASQLKHRQSSHSERSEK